MTWDIIHSGTLDASSIMEKDALLLETLKSDQKPILHLYDWAGDSATFGCFIKPEDYLDLEKAQKKQLRLAKRPTGGGIIFHLSDLAFSVLLPAEHPKFSLNTLENYQLINQAVKEAVCLIADVTTNFLSEEAEPLDFHCKHFCMAKPTQYDVMIGNKKIAGAAQRRTKQGLLHQGTISIGLLPKEYLTEILLPKTQVVAAMEKNSASLLGPNWTKQDLQEMRKHLSNALKKCIQKI